MLSIVTPAEMRAIDAAAPEPFDVLVERAGRRVARAARQMLGGVYGRRVVVIAGPGNNGADGHVAARVLAQAGVRVSIVAPDVSELPAADLVIDGAFGTGLRRPYVAPLHDGPVLAIDVPSGVDGLTGELVGEPMRAWRTVTFAALKPGLLLQPGAQFVGDIEVADIGLDVASSRTWLFTGSDAAQLLPRRDPMTHKWKHAVTVVGGSAGMAGAPRLTAAAAFRTGAGYVRCVLPGGQVPTEASEVVYEAPATHGWGPDVAASSNRFHALVLGPGLAPDAGHDLHTVLDGVDPATGVVVDGTGLRLLGTRPTLRGSVVLTPHDGEYQALAGRPVSPDRFTDARSLAEATGAVVLLKGPLTVIAAPDGRAMAVAHGDARLATAGSGDVLAGAIGALLGAGIEPLQAATLGAWIHADAGRSLPAVGGVASDLVTGLANSLSSLAL